jgi:hypothetical protein
MINHDNLMSESLIYNVNIIISRHRLSKLFLFLLRQLLQQFISLQVRYLKNLTHFVYLLRVV